MLIIPYQAYIVSMVILLMNNGMGSESNFSNIDASEVEVMPLNVAVYVDHNGVILLALTL